MAVHIIIPTPLRPFVRGERRVEVSATTVDEALTLLTTEHRELRKHLFDDAGRLRSYVNVYVNDDDIRSLQESSTPLRENDTISIIPSIAGGSGAVEVEPEVAVSLSKDEVLRYSRHLIIPEVGMTGQKKLKASSVLLIGAGGLGSPLGMYLAAAGVGRIGILDFDVVDLTNLQRQVVHATHDVGRKKLDSAREFISALNPHVRVETHDVRLSSANAMEILAGYDLIVDGTDNFPTRYLVNDACVLLGKSYVYGSIFRFEGQVSVFGAPNGPCYRCLYPSPPPPGLVPSCAEGGVLGVLPGIVGTLQALEAIKLIIGTGEPLIGRLLMFDALDLKFRELKLRKDPACPVCGEHRTIEALIDYEQFCGIDPISGVGSGAESDELTVEELKRRLDRGDDLFLLDVREPHEREIVTIGGTLMPLNDLPERVHELDTSKEIVVYCKVGGRSAKAVRFLMQSGFRRVRNLVGGIDAWAERIDPNLPRY